LPKDTCFFEWRIKLSDKNGISEGISNSVLVRRSNSARKPLRVCFLYYQHFNALVYREAKALQEQGFEVDIICLRVLLGEKLIQRFRGMNVYAIQKRPTAEKSVVSYFLRLLFFYLKAAVLLTALAPARRYSLVHVTAPPDIMVFAALAPKLLGSRIILDIHDIGPELFMRKLHVGEHEPVIRLLKMMEWISSRFADHVITVTDFWKDKLVSRSVDESKCSMLLNVPDEDVFQPLKTPRQRKSFNLYYHGSLEEHFGVDTVLEAMPLIQRHIPNVLLHIVGGKKGRAYQDYRELANRLGLNSRVMFHQGVVFWELPGILADADLGVVPTKDSVFSNEAVSMKALEYIALGIPIVISKTKAHNFYYNSGMVRFFEPCNSEELAKAVIELHDDRELRETMACNAHTFLKDHGWSKSKELYSGIVQRLVFQPQGA
jgi:glycosyltransferase involved in cell wall biosynthesis